MQVQPLVDVREPGDRRARARAADLRVAHAGARRVDLADLDEALRDPADRIGIVRQRGGRVLGLFSRAADTALREQHRGEQEPARHVARIDLHQAFERRLRVLQPAPLDLPLAVVPQLAQSALHVWR